MPYQVRVERRAERDLAAIAQYIGAGGSQAAAIWLSGLYELVMSLASMPRRGSIVGHHPTRRQLLYGHKPHVYRVIYMVDELAQTIDVLQVRHGARRPIR